MEDNRTNISHQEEGDLSTEEKVKEIAKEGAQMVGKIAKEGVKTTGKAAGAVVKTGIRSLMTPIIIGVIIIVVGGGLFAGFKFNWFRADLTIDKTANVIEEVKKIGEFTTACYYEELALKNSYNDTTSIFGIKNVSTKEIVIIGKGRVRAGFDLSKLTENDIKTQGDTISINLPKPEIFDIIMNPTDFTTEYESGTWSHESTKPLKEKARVQLEQDAADYGILTKAEESGQKRLEALFKTFGFNTVLFNIAQPESNKPLADNSDTLCGAGQ